MPSQSALDNLFMDIAARCATESKARRTKVGAVLVRDGNIISMGWNGMPSGMDNNCEIEQPDGTLVTRPEVAHAESNMLTKLLESDWPTSTKGATVYVTLSPCPECAKLLKQAKIKRVVYKDEYRLKEGIDMLRTLGVPCEQMK